MVENSLHSAGITWGQVPKKVKDKIENEVSVKVTDKNKFIHSGMSNFIGDYEVQVRVYKNKKDKKKDLNKKIAEKKKQNRFYNAYYKHRIAVGMLSLAPFNTSGKNLCVKAGICESICIGYSGDSQDIGRIKKSIVFQKNKQKFFELLVKDIVRHVKESRKKKSTPVIRLNGYSDIKWEDKDESFYYTQEIKDVIQEYNKKSYSYKKSCLKHLTPANNQLDNELNSKVTIFDVFPNILFYDYTKHLDREIPANYYLTFSYDKGNNELPHNNDNISVIVSETLKKKLLSFQDKENIDGDKQDCRLIDFEYIDGDKQDCRLIDFDPKEQKIILLAFQKPKQKTKKDLQESDFAIMNEDEFCKLILEPLALLKKQNESE